MDAWLASSQNKTEFILGTYSLASRAATFLPMRNYFKYQIMQMAKEIGLPKSIIESSQKPDPSCGRTKTFSDIPIQDLDDYLFFPNQSKLTDKQEEYVRSIIKKNEFKCLLPTIV